MDFVFLMFNKVYGIWCLQLHITYSLQQTKLHIKTNCEYWGWIMNDSYQLWQDSIRLRHYMTQPTTHAIMPPATFYIWKLYKHYTSNSWLDSSNHDMQYNSLNAIFYGHFEFPIKCESNEWPWIPSLHVVRIQLHV